MSDELEIVARLRDQACADELRRATEDLNRAIKGATHDRDALMAAINVWWFNTRRRADELEGS